MHRVAVVGFLAEVQVGGEELFGLAEEEISARFEIQVQPLDQRATLRSGKLRQHIHAKDAIEASDINGLGQIHRVERDQAADTRLDEQMRSVARRVAVVAIPRCAVLATFWTAAISIRANFRKAAADHSRRQSLQC